MSLLYRTLGAVLLVGAPLAAQTGNAPPRPGHPPQAAIDACASHSDGDACTVTFRDRTIAGTCRKGPNGEEPLACVPNSPPPLPPEAFEACQGRHEGDACRVTLGDRSIDGTCARGPRGDQPLVCRPSDPPSGGS